VVVQLDGRLQQLGVLVDAAGLLSEEAVGALLGRDLLCLGLQRCVLYRGAVAGVRLGQQFAHLGQPPGLLVQDQGLQLASGRL
jgi:hypothetical protein